MLGPIRAITTTAPDLHSVEEAYVNYLGYVVAERGIVSDATAAGWGAPAVAGNQTLVMMPESGEPTFLRFVSQHIPADYKGLTTYGWNATEIIVQNTDLLADRLQNSPFEILCPPHALDGLPDIRAMQVCGPGGEILYLTWVQRPVPGFELPIAKSFVDRCFIAVLGGPDMEAMRSFYKDSFGNQPSERMDTMIHVLSKANGLPLETKYGLATVALDKGSLIEIDQYPPMTTARPKIAGALPPGMAIVTFECADLDKLDLDFIALPQTSQLPPYKGRRSATLIGAAGELIELIEI